MTSKPPATSVPSATVHTLPTLPGQADRLLRELTESSRGALAHLQAALGMLEDTRLEPALRESFIGAARAQAQAMSARLDAAAADNARHQATRWPLEEMRSADFVQAAARRIVDEGLSVREAEALGAARPRKAKPERAPETKSADTRMVEKQLGDILGLNVAINHGPAGGDVRISYRTLEQLDDICRRLKG